MKIHRDEQEIQGADSPPSRQHNEDESYVEMPQEEDEDDDEYQSDSSFRFKSKATKSRTKPKSRMAPLATSPPTHQYPASPKTRQLLSIINSRSLSQIKSLKGVGAKKAEGIVNTLLEADGYVTSLEMLAEVKGVGMKSVEKMREGIVVEEFDDGGRDDELSYGGGATMEMPRMGIVA